MTVDHETFVDEFETTCEIICVCLLVLYVYSSML